jgi:hypothetical protein
MWKQKLKGVKMQQNDDKKLNDFNKNPLFFILLYPSRMPSN